MTPHRLIFDLINYKTQIEKTFHNRHLNIKTRIQIWKAFFIKIFIFVKYRQISFAEFVYISQRIKVIFVMNIVIRKKGIKKQDRVAIFNLRPVLMMISGKIAPGEQSSLTLSFQSPQESHLYTYLYTLIMNPLIST